MRIKTILLSLVGLAFFFFVSLWAMDWIAPRGGGNSPAPTLAETPPLPPVLRSSTIVAPVTIALSAIRDAVERNAPRNLAGKADNPAPQLIQNADINWTVARGPIAIGGANDTISMAMPLNGTVHATGSLSQQAAGAIGNLLGGLLGNNAAKQLGSINIKALNATADIKGNVGVTARPALMQNWRVEPNLTAQVNLGDTTLSASGVKLGLSGQLKPLLDKMVNEQLVAIQQKLRGNPALEQGARREWAKLCRSIPLPAAGPGMPALWLELRPTKAIAAQPRIDAANVKLMLGIEATTGVTTTQTTPSCAFPDALEIVPPQDTGRIDIGLPIDMPFTTLNTIVDAQLKGRTFPEDGNGAVAITVKQATVKPSGDRLLISMVVSAKAATRFFGWGGDATVHVWGKPVLDAANQSIKLANLEVAVESEAAFGLLGTAARTAMPYLQNALAERATIDLKPLAAQARDKIAAAVADLRKDDNGVKINAEITGIRLADIAFDAKTLRVIAEASGSVDVIVTALPGL